jgi:hypothetical protein
MASTNRKRTAVLRDKEVEYLLQSESEQSLSDSDGGTEDDSARQDFVWESMENCKG